MLCEQNKLAIPLSVVHLAGPDKNKAYTLRQTSGGTFKTKLTFNEIINKKN
jgi:hypothetical protein